STARISYGRRNTTTSIETTPTTARRPSPSEAYMQGLLQQLQSLESSLIFAPPETTLQESSSSSSFTIMSDNAVAHSSSTWDRSIVLPPLDRYHPMDDFAIFLLRRNKIHARNVRIIRDNARSHQRPVNMLGKLPVFPAGTAAAATLSPSQSSEMDSNNSSSSLDVSGIAEYLKMKRWSSGSSPTKSPSEHSRTTASTASVTNNSSLNTFLDSSFASMENSAGGSKTQILAPMKEESPNSILELHSSSSEESQQERKVAAIASSAIDTDLFTLDDDEDQHQTSSGDSDDK
ncbi:MAG: hypothetical protein SGILL_005256, partial [Bacillariaceae sp.]